MTHCNLESKESGLGTCLACDFILLLVEVDII